MEETLSKDFGNILTNKVLVNSFISISSESIFILTQSVAISDLQQLQDLYVRLQIERYYSLCAHFTHLAQSR